MSRVVETFLTVNIAKIFKITVIIVENRCNRVKILDDK